MTASLVIRPVTTADGRTLTGGFDPDTGDELIRGNLSEVVRLAHQMSAEPACHNCGHPAGLGLELAGRVYCPACSDGLKDKYREF